MPVGAVEEVRLVDGSAVLTISLQEGVQLPVDTVAELRADGMLGDKMIRLVPGKETIYLASGQELRTAPPGTDLDALTAKAESIAVKAEEIADNVAVITKGLRDIVGAPEFQGRVGNILGNIEELTADLRQMTADSRSELGTLTKNLADISLSVKGLVETTGKGVEAELAAVQQTTATVQRTMENVESITARMERGEGSIGRLLTDDTPVRELEATIAQVNEVVGEVSDLVVDVTRMQTDVSYRGSAYFGTAPDGSGGLAENPMAGSVRNTLGVRIQPREDYWYEAELTSHPLGNITYEDRYLPDLGITQREYVTRPDYRFTFQFARRFQDVVFRFGIKESSGGVGVDGLLFGDRLMLSADLYDFTYGSWPLLDGTPNLQTGLRAWPTRFFYVEAGADNVIFNAQHGFFTGYAGGGFRFNDQDLKLILPSLPL